MLGINIIGWVEFIKNLIAMASKIVGFSAVFLITENVSRAIMTTKRIVNKYKFIACVSMNSVKLPLLFTSRGIPKKDIYTTANKYGIKR